MNPAFLAAVVVASLWGSSLRAESPALSSTVEVIHNLPYKANDQLSPYEKERCKLDLYLPREGKGFSTLVWFHGGGLKSGNKEGAKKVAESLAKAGIGVVVPNYRLSPNATYPAYIQDAAAAVAWTNSHIAEHGGNPKKLFVGGHSAGGYLTLMLGLDAHYLSDVGLKTSDLAGLIPVSGQTMTHYTVREERKIGKFTITADEAAPVFYIRKDTCPMLVLYADHDMAGRAEENLYFVSMMKGAGNTKVTGTLIADRTHGTIGSNIANEGDPARLALLDFMTASGK